MTSLSKDRHRSVLHICRARAVNKLFCREEGECCVVPCPWLAAGLGSASNHNLACLSIRSGWEWCSVVDHEFSKILVETTQDRFFKVLFLLLFRTAK